MNKIILLHTGILHYDRRSLPPVYPHQNFIFIPVRNDSNTGPLHGAQNESLYMVYSGDIVVHAPERVLPAA
ncbi:MAG: hypothetical protein WAV76_02540 [Bacteroidota bacterium]